MAETEAAPTAKICGLCCFNTLFFISGCVFIFKIFQLLNAKAMTPYGVGDSFSAAFGLTIVVSILIISVSILGFVSLCVDKAPVYLVHGILLLVCLILQIACNTLSDKAALEILGNQLQLNDLPKFGSIETTFQKQIQNTQQEYSCCGYLSYKEYYHTDTERDIPSVIPNSCCGKYNEHAYSSVRGDCSVESYSTKPGCGDHLSKSYLYLVVPKGVVVFSNVLVYIFYVIQFAAAGGSFYIFIATKRQNAGTQMIYN